MRFLLFTLGCKINQYESQALREAWIGRGFIEVDDPAEAELALVNSCAVTAQAVADLRQTLRRLHRENPGLRILATGCAAQVMAAELAGFPGVDAVIPQSEKARLASWPGNEATAGNFALCIKGFERTRAVLKVQDGCSQGCAYCIVPLTRGPATSRQPTEVLAEARRLLESGAPEIMISGINLRQYGRGLDGEHAGWDFWDLLAFLDRELADWRGRARLRLSSMDPSQLGDKALETLSRCSLVCPSLHVSLQSASPRVLRAMGRGRTDPVRLAGFLEELQGIWPVHGLGMDILTGFPGEDEAAFAETLNFCESLPLTYAHVFPYSRRPGTRAADFPDQVPEPVKKERARLLRELAAAKRQVFWESLLARSALDVAVEEDGRTGMNEFYAPCRIEGRAEWSGLVRVRPLAVKGRHLTVAGECSTPAGKDG